MKNRDRDERQLVCEGNCNENLVARYDAGVKKGIRETPSRRLDRHQKQGTILVPDWALQLVRHMKHTPHARLNRSDSVCLVCNTIRKYDWPIDGEIYEPEPEQEVGSSWYPEERECDAIDSDDAA